VTVAMLIISPWNADAKVHRAVVLNADGTELLPTQSREAIHPDDSLALVAFYYAMQGDYWLDNSGWLTEPVDLWVGVEQVQNVGTFENPEWRVTRLRTIRFNMTRPGYIPAEIGNMEYLQIFRVQRDRVTGGIPVEVENMRGLTQWQSHANYSLTGEVPWESFEKLPRLDFVYLSHNSFYGALPNPENFESEALRRFRLNNNYFSGTIPEGFGQKTVVQDIDLSYNRLHGPLPNLGDLTMLRRLILSGNDLDPGPIDDWIWLLNHAEHLDALMIDNTNRTGEIPMWLSDITNLQELSIGETAGYFRSQVGRHKARPENLLGGDLPESLLLLFNLEMLWVHGQHWNGENGIPEWLGDMDALTRLSFIDTNFEGPIPDNLGNLSGVFKFVFIRNHQLTGGIEAFRDNIGLSRLIIEDNTSMEIGPFPSWLDGYRNIYDLRLSNAGLTGNIPAFLTDMNLTHLHLRDNPGLTGNLPDLSAWRVVQLDISRTGLNINEVPSWLNSATSREALTHLGLAGLGIEGPLPAWLGELFWLDVLVLDDNNFSGPIPESFCNFVIMDSLNLANNQLSGNIPSCLANVGSVGRGDALTTRGHSLILSGNEGLTGDLPLAFTERSWYENFRYDGTGLCSPTYPDGAFEDWLEAINENAFNRFPPSYVSVKVNVDGCVQSTSVPVETAYLFRLRQNYPNPFNPSTTIYYEIPDDMHVKLTVYNLLGQKVSTIVNETRSAGQHEIHFDASGMASGTYIYRLEAGNKVQTHTMMLIK
jgi:Leucine-rich repeat (LRR) protein